MSENEKTSEGAAPVVVVSAVGSGHQPPRADCAYRVDSADTKRSHAPLPPVFLQELKKVQAKSSSANEKLQTRYDECAAATMELKNLKEVSSDSGKLVSSEKKQSERGEQEAWHGVMESESLPQNVTKKMSAGVKKQKTEEITMASLYSDIKPCVTPPYQPIPAPPETVAEDLALPVKPKEVKEEAKTTQEDDSITEDVAELRIPDAKPSDWDGKKKITWEGINKVQLKTTYSQEIQLERKMSIGPYRSATAFEPASGIVLCMPRHPNPAMSLDKEFCNSGIKITIAKKCGTKITGEDYEKRAIKIDPNIPYIKIIAVLKAKYEVFRNRIKTVFKSL